MERCSATNTLTGPGLDVRLRETLRGLPCDAIRLATRELRSDDFIRGFSCGIAAPLKSVIEALDELVLRPPPSSRRNCLPSLVRHRVRATGKENKQLLRSAVVVRGSWLPFLRGWNVRARSVCSRSRRVKRREGSGVGVFAVSH